MATCLTCGETLLPRKYIRKSGKQKGVSHGVHTPKKYCSRRCQAIGVQKIGAKVQQDRAAYRHFDRHGYVILGSGGKYQQPEHRAVMETILGRKLEKHETVHHKDGNRGNNRPENLELWAGRHGRGQRATDILPNDAGLVTGFLSFGT